MNILEFSLAVGVVACLAGFLGALTGLGGGMLLVPVLVLGFDVDIRYAIGASLVSVIATSSGAASAYVKEGFTNLRIGMFLEIATVLGAVLGAFVAAKISTGAVAILLGVVLVYSAVVAARPQPQTTVESRSNRLASALKLDSSYPTPNGSMAYHVHAIPFGFSMMFIAGSLSGLLGIGSGAFKVLAMDQVMRIPFKVSTTTSNFMIGVTATASAGVYLGRGYIDPGLSMPVLLGVLAGAMLGAWVLPRTRTRWLRRIFSLVLVVLAGEMIYHGAIGKF